MKCREPIPHWNNFSVPELKEILEHCQALERIGIAQDEEMVISIERDIKIREKKKSKRYEPIEPKHRGIKQQNKRQQQPQNHLLEQNLQH